MNPHILSHLERKRLLAYNLDKQETSAIRNIRSRAIKNMPRLMKDLFLTALFLEEKELANLINNHIDWETSINEAKLRISEEK